MIGNDVVDLELARNESNWKRNGFLDKIFTNNEQKLIQKSINQENTIWNLWSRKEAVYKIWNRDSNIRIYNPIAFECLDVDYEIGLVKFKNNIYYTKTEITKDFIYTIAVSNLNDFKKISVLNSDQIIVKNNNIPFYYSINQEIKPISKTHHGRFEFVIGL